MAVPHLGRNPKTMKPIMKDDATEVIEVSKLLNIML